MTDIELLQHSITPADVLFVTLATLKVLGCQGVEALHGQYLPHGLVDAAGCQALAVAGGLQTRQSDRPHPVRHPQEQWSAEEGVRG